MCSNIVPNILHHHHHQHYHHHHHHHQGHQSDSSSGSGIRSSENNGNHTEVFESCAFFIFQIFVFCLLFTPILTPFQGPLRSLLSVKPSVPLWLEISSLTVQLLQLLRLATVFCVPEVLLGVTCIRYLPVNDTCFKSSMGCSGLYVENEILVYSDTHAYVPHTHTSVNRNNKLEEQKHL